MKLSECKIGEIVCKGDAENPIIGHIVNLNINSAGEVVPVVRWAFDGCVIMQHHTNLFLLDD